MSEGIKTPKESPWRMWLLAAAVLVFVVVATWNTGTRIATQTKTTSSIDNVIEATEKVCGYNHRLAAQYRIRGEAEKALFGFFLSLAHKSVTEGEDGASQRFIDRFGPLAQKIHILPLPNCRRQGEELRESLPPG
jgi:hypothetical protein